MLNRAEVPAEIEPDLFDRLAAVVDDGMTIVTLGPSGRPNTIEAFTPEGAWVLTARSKGVPRLVPGWMFNVAWRELTTARRLSSSDLMSVAKRSSAVLAVLALLPEVSVVSTRPLEVGYLAPTAGDLAPPV